MSSDWNKTSLGDICEIIGGGTPKTSINEYWGGDIPWLSVTDLKLDNRYVHTTEKTITKLGLNNCSTKILNKGDLIISARGTVGKLAQLSKPMAFNQSCYGLRSKDKTINEFLYYSIKGIIKEIRSKTHGSVFSTITRNTFDLLEIFLPPLWEQKAIAATLSCLDDMIELNNRANKVLEEMAQAIFKHWFVDFEFPDENGEPYKSSGGEMVESELGEIPMGWKIVSLNEIVEICIGGDWGKEKETENYVPVICLRGTDLQSLKENGQANKAPIRWVKENSLVKRKILDNDILIGGSGLGPIGRSLYCAAGIKRIFDYPVIYSNFCKKIRAINSGYAVFIEHLIERKYKSGEMQNYMSGTSIPNLDMAGLLNSVIVLPDDTLISRYANIKQSYFKNKFSQTNLILTNIRDTHLPKLISGEIRVPVEGVG